MFRLDPKLIKLVNKQAEDDGLWFIARTASEAYLQQELRKLLTLHGLVWDERYVWD